MTESLEGMVNGYLVAAYTAVWLVIVLYLGVLIVRNRRLSRRLDEIEAQLAYITAQKSGKPSR